MPAFGRIPTDPRESITDPTSRWGIEWLCASRALQPSPLVHSPAGSYIIYYTQVQGLPRDASAHLFALRPIMRPYARDRETMGIIVP